MSARPTRPNTEKRSPIGTMPSNENTGPLVDWSMPTPASKVLTPSVTVPFAV